MPEILPPTASGRRTFRLATLGCRTNQYETQAYRDQLLQMGWVEAAHDEAADLCIVNTCTVTESADSSSKQQIRRLHRDNPKAKIVVTGCLAEKEEGQLKALPGVEQIIFNKDKESLIDHLFPDVEQLPEFKITHFEAHTRAFVKVQDGCNSFCSYCIIPYVRGRSRSRPIEPIIQEIEGLVASGYQEVVLTGINIGDYDYGLADLVRRVDAIEGIKRVRLSSIDPDEVDEALMGAILEGKHTCPSLHLVLQSGSNVILKRMNRKYTRQIFLHTVDKLRAAHPKFTFTTDIIVGFPGETDLDFEETLQVVQEVQFTKVHLFPFSPRPRTRAALYPQLPASVIAERKQILLRRAEEEAFKGRQSYVGERVEVLLENGDEGHTDNFIPVQAKGSANQLVTVMIHENSASGLVGTCL